MSSWQTISVKHMDGSTESFQRYTSGDKNPRIERTMVSSKGCQFDDSIFWLCHDVGDGYVISVSDTSDGGTIRQLFGGGGWSVHRHEGSLWTADVHHGPSYDWKEDVLADLPDWAKVGGNWSHMDEP